MKIVREGINFCLSIKIKERMLKTIKPIMRTDNLQLKLDGPSWLKSLFLLLASPSKSDWLVKTLLLQQFLFVKSFFVARVCVSVKVFCVFCCAWSSSSWEDVTTNTHALVPNEATTQLSFGVLQISYVGMQKRVFYENGII